MAEKAKDKWAHTVHEPAECRASIIEARPRVFRWSIAEKTGDKWAYVQHGECVTLDDAKAAGEYALRLWRARSHDVWRLQ